MKYFVFDVDGTLLNSAEVDQQCLKQTLHEFGRDYTFEELRPSFGKPGRQTLADLGFTGETAERIMDRWEGLSKERASEVLAFDGIEALLRELHARGCRCGIVTSRTHYQFDYGFSPLGLDGYFDAVICMEDAPRHKPAPDPAARMPAPHGRHGGRGGLYRRQRVRYGVRRRGRRKVVPCALGHSRGRVHQGRHRACSSG